MKYYLGLDNGGTNTKAAIFDEHGAMVAVESVATAALLPAPGFAERDMDDMWQDNCTVLRRLMDTSGVAAGDIAAIGLCGHGKGLYLWGKDDRPVRRGILSADNRAWRYPLQWRKDGTEARAFALSCQHILACQPVSLLAWLRDNEPDALSRTRWIFECKDYLRFRLTGEARAEITDYSGTGLMDLRKKDFDRDLLAIFGLEDMLDALPPVCQSLDIAGHVTEQAAAETGLAPGTPVIGGMFDIDACALAANVTDEENICMIAGTWSINEYIRKSPVTDGRVLMNSCFCLPGYYLIEESSPTSAGNSEWFVRNLLPEVSKEAKAAGQSVYDVMNRWAAGFDAADAQPIFLPFLSAGNADPMAKGAFLGLTAAHGRENMVRAVYEGVAFSHRWHLEQLLRTRDSRQSTIRLAGGAARSEVWTQIFADVTGLPVETIAAAETGALGCAIAAAAACEGRDIRQTAAAMSAVSRRVTPRPEASAAYDKKYALYCRAIECLRPFWPDMQAMMEP